ncbi:tail assembly chaperone [Pseudomonas phage PspYZU01]|uniref:Tail assembly protein n=1 Tax=Pseudomonas phage PspYZU01 TaxID=1983555 RepID=A0A2U7NMV8_9CAUD|nr:tail assembly chaperone [Pseudomonas phage PspYZU01]ASD51917.1 hypothetical protein PspYZU01_32 [Pseudomonas phage PspYZU01]
MQIAIAIVVAVIAYSLMPKPKSPKPPAAADFEQPTADAGRPIPVVFGRVTIKGLNILGYWDVQTVEFEYK